MGFNQQKAWVWMERKPICVVYFFQENKMKVYCEDCKWYFCFATDTADMSECNHPKNMIIVDESNYKYEWIHKKSKDVPWKLNKNNNCKYYQRKWWKFWIEK